MPAFNDAVTAIPEIEQVHLIAGNFDYLLKVRTRDMRAYRMVLAEKISTLPHVANTSTYVAMQAVKEGSLADVTWIAAPAPGPGLPRMTGRALALCLAGPLGDPGRFRTVPRRAPGHGAGLAAGCTRRCGPPRTRGRPRHRRPGSGRLAPMRPTRRRGRC